MPIQKRNRNKKPTTKLSKSQVWAQYKALGLKGLTWRSTQSDIQDSINMAELMKNAVMQNFHRRFSNPEIYSREFQEEEFIEHVPKLNSRYKGKNKPDYVETVGGTSRFNKIDVKWYADNNPKKDKKYSVETIRDSINKLFNNKTKRQVMLRITNGDQTVFRTFTESQFEDFCDNALVYDGEITGSDADRNGYYFDVSGGVGVICLPQKQDIKGHCNTDRNKIQTLNHLIVENPQSRKKDCFDACLRRLGFNNMKTLRQGVTVTQAIEIIQKDNLPISIVYDQLDSNGIVYAHKKQDSKFTLAFIIKENDGHWVIVREFKTPQVPDRFIKVEKQTKKGNGSKLYCYHDYETTFNQENFARPYSLSWFITKDPINITPENKQEYLEQCKFTTTNDCENVTNKMLQDICQYGSFDQVVLINFNGSNFDNYLLLEDIQSFDFSVECTFSGKSLLGMRFKNFVCWDLAKFLVGSLDYNCQSFNTTFKKIGDFSHKLFQTAQDEGRLPQFIANNYSTIQEYNKYDVLSMAEITQKFRDAVIGICKSDPLDHSTIGSHSYHILKESLKLKLHPMTQCPKGFEDEYIRLSLLVPILEKKSTGKGQQIVEDKPKRRTLGNSSYDSEKQKPKYNFMLDAPMTEGMDLFQRKCLNAGRTEVMQSKNHRPVHLKGRNLSMVDVVSLYPSVMLALNKFPVGECQWVHKQDETKLGFYEIRCQQRKDMPNVLPKRDYENPTKPLDWKCKDYETFFCTTVDIEVLRKHGNKVKVVRGLEYESWMYGKDIFACLEPFKMEKIRQDCYKTIKSPKYNVAIREACKLYLNSLSGKVIQRNFDDLTQIVRNSDDYMKFLDKALPDSVTLQSMQGNYVVLNGKSKNPYAQHKAKPSQLGVYIYAYARKLMYNEIFSRVRGEYTDTDSCLMTYENEQLLRLLNPEMFKKEKITIDGREFDIKPFGSLDCEINPQDNINEAILLQAKNYLVMNRDTKNYVKVKCKGISFKKDFCRYDDGSLLSKDPTRFFDEMLSKKVCVVQCEQLTISNMRNSRNTQFGIRFRKVTKTLKLKE